MTWGEVAQLLTSVAVLGSWVTSLRNSRKLNKVQELTNGMSKAFGEAKRDQGTAEGTAVGLAARPSRATTMRLLALSPQFIAYVERNDEGVLRNFKVPVRTLPEADGISFRCPVCSADGKPDARFAHFVLCWFEGRVPDSAVPGPGRWNPRGHGYKDLSFVPGKGSKSVLLLGGCNAHFHITDGEVHP